MLTKVLEQLVPLAPEEGNPRSSVVQMFAPKLLLTAFDPASGSPLSFLILFLPFSSFTISPYRPPRPSPRPLPSSTFFSFNCPLPHAPLVRSHAPSSTVFVLVPPLYLSLLLQWHSFDITLSMRLYLYKLTHQWPCNGTPVLTHTNQPVTTSYSGVYIIIIGRGGVTLEAERVDNRLMTRRLQRP